MCRSGLLLKGKLKFYEKGLRKDSKLSKLELRFQIVKVKER